MASYYKKIKGKDYDRAMLEAAESSVKGKGDGRISLRDAKRILAIVSDSGAYSPVEKRTMQYIRDKFSFTPEADTWFRTQVRKQAAQRGAKKTAVKKPAKPARAKKAAAKKPAGEKIPASATPYEFPGDTRPVEPPSRGKDRGGMSMGKKILLVLLVILTVGLIIFFMKSPQCNREEGMDESMRERAQIKPAGEKDASTAQNQAQDARGPADDEQKAPEKDKNADDPNTYTVLEKESLISISEKITGDYRDWEKIFAANRDSVKDPRMIFVGQKLKLPEGMKKKQN